jgi:hypothetical protein
MRYILLIYQNTKAWNGLSQEDKDVFKHAAGDIVEELSASGEWVDGEALADASQARSTHVRDGVVTVTDWPFLEAKEALPATASSTSPPRSAPRRSPRAGQTPSTGAWRSAR